jgi:hypothetical protein
MGKVKFNPNWVLNICLTISLVFILLYDFWLKEVPEIVFGGQKFGALMYQISLAFITSYTFFFVNDLMKKKVTEANLSPYLAKKTFSIINQTHDLFAQIAQESKEIFQSKYPTKEELKTALEKIPGNSNAPLIQITNGEKPLALYLNWTQYLHNYRNGIVDSINKIFNLMPHLETEHIKILNEIDECAFFKSIGTVASIPATNQDISFLTNVIHACGLLVESLEEYYDEKLITFSPGYVQSKS